MAVFSPEAEQAAGFMKKSLKELSQEELSVDHAALFVGPFELIAPPYGSVYIEKKRIVKGESTLFAARCYEKAGLSVDTKEPEDHVAIELEFMYYLCGKEVTALQEKRPENAQHFNDMQRLFYFKAMKPWIKEFCAAIRGGTQNVFYKNVAACLDAFFLFCEKYYSEGSATSGG